MNIAQALIWVTTGQQLVMAGLATADAIRGFIKSQHPDVTDADLNAIMDAVIAGATRHKALAQADAGVKP